MYRTAGLEINLYELQHDKTNKMICAPAKTPISLGIRAVWSESLLCALWVAKDPVWLIRLWMAKLIRVFTGRTGHFVAFVVLRCIFVHVLSQRKAKQYTLYMTENWISFLLLIIPFICPFFFLSNQIFSHRFLGSYDSQSAHILYAVILRVAKFIVGRKTKTLRFLFN